MSMQIENNLWRSIFFILLVFNQRLDHSIICLILSDVDLSAINGKLAIFLHVFLYLYDLQICMYIMICKKIQN
jgi:hypothetical protein